MNAEEMLREVSAISEKYDLLYKKTGAYFNIFKIANIATDEVTVCRVLCELLSPKGCHYQGALYLKLFVKHVLKREDIPDSELDDKDVVVEREKVIAGNRRIDIFISTGKHRIPIEVKIYAGDQDKQLQDYYKEAKESNIYYLTAMGDAPTDVSKGNLSDDKITQISFAYDILNWVELCLIQPQTIRLAPIREVLQQFASAIRGFTNQMEDDKVMEIKKAIMESTESFESAKSIAETLLSVKINMMTSVFADIESHIGKRLQIIDKSYESEVSAYYHTKSRSAGMRFLIGVEKSTNTAYFLTFEITDNLYFGVSEGYKDNDGNFISRKTTNSINDIYTLTKLNPLNSEKQTPWFYWWEYLPDETRKMNFRNCTGAYLNLFDKEKHGEIMQEIYEIIDKFLEGIKQ